MSGCQALSCKVRATQFVVLSQPSLNGTTYYLDEFEKAKVDPYFLIPLCQKHLDQYLQRHRLNLK